MIMLKSATCAKLLWICNALRQVRERENGDKLRKNATQKECSHTFFCLSKAPQAWPDWERAEIGLCSFDIAAAQVVWQQQIWFVAPCVWPDFAAAIESVKHQVDWIRGKENPLLDNNSKQNKVKDFRKKVLAQCWRAPQIQNSVNCEFWTNTYTHQRSTRQGHWSSALLPFGKLPLEERDWKILNISAQSCEQRARNGSFITKGNRKCI